MFVWKAAERQTKTAAKPTSSLPRPVWTLTSPRNVSEKHVSGASDQKEVSPNNTSDRELPRGASWDFSKVSLLEPDRRGLPQASSALQGIIQPKLVVGEANDPLEDEADRIADQVAGGATFAAVSINPARIQRAAPIEGRDAVRMAPSSVDHVLATAGSPLEPAVRENFAQSFGYDFSHVRVHSGPAASRSAHDLNARAYTTGNTIVFGDGQFSTQTTAGRRLLAHELTHTIQQKTNAGLQPRVIQRDLAVEPTVATPVDVALPPAQLRDALRFNAVLFTDVAEVAIIRDVLGIAKDPPVVDEDFVNAIVRYQAGFGLIQDGELGAATAGRLEREITAEADGLGQPPTGTPMRRVARRLHLRAMTSRRAGSVTHQGFLGPDDNPTGAVTVRTGDLEPGAANAISLEHTGEDSDAVDWLQFINMQMFATPVPAAPPVFNAGTVGTTGGPVDWSNAATTRWFVDAVPGAASPLYNVSGFMNTRAAARRLAMFDEPGGASGLPVAQAFTAAGAPAAGAADVTMRMGFDSYVIRNNLARYHVAWRATTHYDINAATSSSIAYAQGAAGSVTGLRAEHRAALLAEYPGNPIV